MQLAYHGSAVGRKSWLDEFRHLKLGTRSVHHTATVQVVQVHVPRELVFSMSAKRKLRRGEGNSFLNRDHLRLRPIVSFINPR